MGCVNQRQVEEKLGMRFDDGGKENSEGPKSGALFQKGKGQVVSPRALTTTRLERSRSGEEEAPWGPHFNPMETAQLCIWSILSILVG